MLSLNQLKNLYSNSPLWVKKIYASIPFEIRNGEEYRNWRAFLNKEIDEEIYELKKIQESVAYAYENTKYYKNLFDKLDIKPEDIKSKKDFQKIPYIDKDIVREHYNDFIVPNFPKKKILKVTTGGSSGAPMEYIQSKNIWAKELAYYMYFFAKFGYKNSILKASFRGGNFSNLKKGVYWIYNPVNNEIIFSPSHLNENTIMAYVSELNKIKPKYFHGFPSSILFLIHHMETKKLFLNFQVDTIFLVSESFSEEDVRYIADYFNCNVASTYGHSERLIFGESIGKIVLNYKIDKRYGFFELVNNDGVISNNNIKGEIVGTGFDNYAMPLLRYKTGDFTAYQNIRESIINLVESPRNQLSIDCKDHSKIAFAGLIKASEMLEYGIIKYQIIQEKIGEIKLYIIPGPKFDNNCKNKLRFSLKNKVDNRLDIEIIITSTLTLTKSGKCLLLIKDYK